jgi:hypothetical protein
MTDDDVKAIKDRYSHYPENLNKNTAVYHVRQLLAEVERLREKR